MAQILFFICDTLHGSVNSKNRLNSLFSVPVWDTSYVVLKLYTYPICVSVTSSEQPDRNVLDFYVKSESEEKRKWMIALKKVFSRGIARQQTSNIWPDVYVETNLVDTYCHRSSFKKKQSNAAK